MQISPLNQTKQNSKQSFGIVGVPGSSITNPEVFSLIQKGLNNKTVSMAKNNNGKYCFYFLNYVKNSKKESDFIKHLSTLIKGAFSVSKATAREDLKRFVEDDLSEIMQTKRKIQDLKANEKLINSSYTTGKKYIAK